MTHRVSAGVPKKQLAGVILGAGFSFVAGLPLTYALFDVDVLISSRSARARFDAVWQEWRQWKTANGSKGPEQFLEAVYEGTVAAQWAHVVELVSAVLATPRGNDWPTVRNPRYAGRITVPLRCEPHWVFWNKIFQRFDVLGVVTTNYDLIAERGIRHRIFPRLPRPGFFYGGISQPQFAFGTAQPYSVDKADRIIQLNGKVPLFKIHGSLNWHLNASSGNIDLYQDMRPAFRNGGDALIVPPLTEKTIPTWLTSVWADAEHVLSACETWLVCGYSLPVYDLAIQHMLTRAASAGNVKQVALFDPYATAIAPRWVKIAPRAIVSCHEGLPDALSAPPLS